MRFVVDRGPVEAELELEAWAHPVARKQRDADVVFEFGRTAVVEFDVLAGLEDDIAAEFPAGIA